jgi:hypothetical protein
MWVHVGMKGGVDAGWVRKTLRFFFCGNALQIAIFLVLHSPSTLSGSKNI